MFAVGWFQIAGKERTCVQMAHVLLQNESSFILQCCFDDVETVSIEPTSTVRADYLKQPEH